jgi:mRNA interferase RelE/StbE
VSEEEGYELVLTPPEVRAIRTGLPEAVAAAVIEFMTGPLVSNPRRVGKMLRREIEGIWSARRGTYRAFLEQALAGARGHSLGHGWGTECRKPL